ncbi:MAG: hydrolase [Firmicutes bacterium]|nr:hydrolase [Bacillota bacterium]
MSILVDKKKAILVVVDIQGKLLGKIRFNEMVVENTLKLIEYAKVADIPIIITEQYKKGLGDTVESISQAIPDFAPIEKTSFGCFGEPDFKKALKATKRDTLIIVGIETHICVCQTALEALENYKVYIPTDAVSSRHKNNWMAGLERMKEEGATLVTTEMLIYEMMKEAGTEEFKKMLPHFKEKPEKEKMKDEEPRVY